MYPLLITLKVNVMGNQLKKISYDPAARTVMVHGPTVKGFLTAKQKGSHSITNIANSRS